jgi:tellurite resistance protein TerA
MSQTVSLTKSAPKVSLEKSPSTGGELSVNLNWDQTKIKKSGLLGRLKGSDGIDLDLACLWELHDGRKGVVQALGNSMGSFQNAPFLELDGDDRSGTSTSGETIRVNLANFSDIKRLMFFTFIYEGAASWEQANGVVIVTPPAGDKIEVRLDEFGSDKRMCAIALVENNGGAIDITRQVRFFGGHEELDRAYGWGMSWTAGRK